jgi:hypothetical protein
MLSSIALDVPSALAVPSSTAIELFPTIAEISRSVLGLCVHEVGQIESTEVPITDLRLVKRYSVH